MPYTQSLVAQPISEERFRPFGQLIVPTEDGKIFDDRDAQLVLSPGIPRFYLMELVNRGLRFHQMTRHRCCTQCLGSVMGSSWLLAVAPPREGEVPDRDSIAVFQISGFCFIKLEVGTWHAGPYFQAQSLIFYNLELSDTNLTDHVTHDFRKTHQLEFELLIPSDD